MTSERLGPFRNLRKKMFLRGLKDLGEFNLIVVGPAESPYLTQSTNYIIVMILGLFSK